MIPRQAEKMLSALAREFRVVALVGPRQSGKTTLAKAVFSRKPYVNLEEPDQRTFAHDDPRGFLAQFPEGAVIDEAQRCPDLFSYLQGIVDAKSEPGQFILTGSQHFGLLERITQSLAGRVGFLQLLPFSFGEIASAGLAPESLDPLLYLGGYPPIYDQEVAPHRWYSAYITTYVERDVRQLLNVRDLGVFQRFVALCAGNVGQLLNTSRLGADCGVNHSSVRAWLDTLQASFIVFLLRPHHRNFRKRMVKAPKLYFYDTGLAARLLGIESPSQLRAHALRGVLFENWVILELLKSRYNGCKDANLYFWRNHTGEEIDLIADHGEKLLPVEIKAGSTIAADWFEPLRRWQALAGAATEPPWLVYGGDQRQTRSGVEALPWRQIAELADRV
ncbi:MAG: ATP-binding protein [Planctomycetes bacterium]|nr:ATP-binding protein [Planctomycetota bacterium]